MKLYRPARPSPRPFLAAPRRSRAATAAPIAATRSAAAENKERSSSGDNEKKTTGPVVAEAKMPPSALLSPEAKNTVALLRSLGTGDVVHTGGETFLSHLVGVYRVLKSWGCPEPLCLAGLAHSIYSTEGFQGFSLECTAASRARVANALGSLEAERVAHVFCCTDRGSQDRDLFLSEEEEEGAPVAGAEGGAARRRARRRRRRRSVFLLLLFYFFSSAAFRPRRGTGGPLPRRNDHAQPRGLAPVHHADAGRLDGAGGERRAQGVDAFRVWKELASSFFFSVFFFFLACPSFHSLVFSFKKKIQNKQLGHRPGLGLQAEGLCGDGSGRGRPRGPDARGGDGEGARGREQGVRVAGLGGGGGRGIERKGKKMGKETCKTKKVKEKHFCESAVSKRASFRALWPLSGSPFRARCVCTCSSSRLVRANCVESFLLGREIRRMWPFDSNNAFRLKKRGRLHCNLSACFSSLFGSLFPLNLYPVNHRSVLQVERSKGSVGLSADGAAKSKKRS